MFKRKGQSTLEYALIIAVVVAGLLLMQHYVKRGYAGRLRSASDDMGEQYDPAKYKANWKIDQSSRTVQSVQNKVTATTHIADQKNNRTGDETVGSWAADEDLYSN